MLHANARPRSSVIRESARGMTLQLGISLREITPRHPECNAEWSAERRPSKRRRVASYRRRSLSRVHSTRARTPPLDASARVTVTKRRAVSVSRCSAAPHPYCTAPHPVPFHPPSHFPPPPCPRGPGRGTTVSHGYPDVALVPHGGGGRWEFTSPPSGAAVEVEGHTR